MTIHWPPSWSVLTNNNMYVHIKPYCWGLKSGGSSPWDVCQKIRCKLRVFIVGGTNLNNRCVEKQIPAKFSEVFCCFLPSFNGFDLCSVFFGGFFRITWWPGLALKWWVNPISYRDGLYMGKFHASKEKTPVLKPESKLWWIFSPKPLKKGPFWKDNSLPTINFPGIC